MLGWPLLLSVLVKKTGTYLPTLDKLTVELTASNDGGKCAVASGGKGGDVAPIKRSSDKS